jgi:hypothetical protein
LQPGVSWEAGFCDGLANSRIFMPILSRQAINSPTVPHQNITNLTQDSKCDNVLLEYLLSLELSERGLIEKIYPVMIGDLELPAHHATGSARPSEIKKVYRNYFSSG